MKIRPVGAELFYADGQTDKQTGMIKLIVAFRNFVKAPKSRCLVDNLEDGLIRPLSTVNL